MNHNRTSFHQEKGWSKVLNSLRKDLCWSQFAVKLKVYNQLILNKLLKQLIMFVP